MYQAYNTSALFGNFGDRAPIFAGKIFSEATLVCNNKTYTPPGVL